MTSSFFQRLPLFHRRRRRRTSRASAGEGAPPIDTRRARKARRALRIKKKKRSPHSREKGLEQLVQERSLVVEGRAGDLADGPQDAAPTEVQSLQESVQAPVETPPAAGTRRVPAARWIVSARVGRQVVHQLGECADYDALAVQL